MSRLWPLPFADVMVLVFTMSIIFAEGFSALVRRKGCLIQLGFVCVALVIGVLAFYYLEGTTNPRVLRPIAYFGFVLWSVAVPVVVLAAAAHAIGRIQTVLLRHICLMLGSMCVALIWPFFVLSSLCASGLDCI